mgnify:CR=1 FL=1
MIDKCNFVSTVLFLGYDSSKTKIIEHIKKLGVNVIHEDKKEIEETKFQESDLVVSLSLIHI